MASEIKVDTVSEKTSGSGVTIDGLLIKDGGISGDVSLIGTTPTFTIGDAGAEDAALVFDGNAQDFYVGLDDSSDSLVMGLGSALGTTPAITINSSQVATLAQRPVFSSGITIADAGQIGSASDADAIAIASNGVVTFSQNPVFPDGGVAVADLDIDGATDIGAAIVDADLFIIDDGAGGTNRKVTASRLKTYTTPTLFGAGVTDVLMDATNFTNSILIQTSSNGSAPTTGTLSSANDNVGMGNAVFEALTGGQQNTAIGTETGRALTTGVNNTFLGYYAGTGTTTGGYNVFIGKAAGAANTTASDNVFIGQLAGTANTTGTHNIAIGDLAYDNADTESNNIAIGKDSMTSAVAGGEQNVAVGNASLFSLTSADNCVAVGYNSGSSITTGGTNTVVGVDAGKTISTGGGHTCIGYASGDAVTTGSNSTFLGIHAGGAVTTGSQNTCVGQYAGVDITTGISNVALGHDAGKTNVSGDFNICIGKEAKTSASDADNAIVIGHAITAAANDFTFGKASNTVSNDFDTDNAWTQSSDVRKKKNIKDAVLGLDFVNDLRPVTYQWKPSYDFPKDFVEYNEENQMTLDKTMHGLVAQEVKAALDKTGVERFGGWKEDADGCQRISKEMFVFPLIKAVQELTAQVSTLQNEVKTLKGE